MKTTNKFKGLADGTISDTTMSKGTNAGGAPKVARYGKALVKSQGTLAQPKQNISAKGINPANATSIAAGQFFKPNNAKGSGGMSIATPIARY